MNAKERFQKTLQLAGPADRVPGAPPFQGYWALDAYGVTVPESLAEPQKAVTAITRAQADCPFDAIEVSWDWFAFVDACGCTSNITDAGSPAVVTNPLTSIEQIGDLAPVDTSKDARVQASIAAAESLMRTFGDEVFCYATVPLPFTLAGHLRGVDNLMMDVVESTDAAHQLLEYSTQVLLDHMEHYRALGVHGFFICDPTASGDLISPRHFEEFAAPHTKSVVQALKKLGMVTILHVCGNTAKILPAVVDIAPEVFSFDHVVDTAVAKEAIGDSVCLLGNLDPVETLFRGTAAQVKERANASISKGREGGGYVLGAGCDLCPETSVENVRAMIDAGHASEY